MRKWEIFTVVLLISLIIFCGLKYYTLNSTPCLTEVGQIDLGAYSMNVTQCDYVKVISFALLGAMIVATLILILLIRSEFIKPKKPALDSY